MTQGTRVVLALVLAFIAIRVQAPRAEATGNTPQQSAVTRAEDPRPKRAERPSAVNYVIEVALDPISHRLTANARVRWRNTSAQPQQELYVHLYLNAFRDASSRFMRKEVTGFRGHGRPTHWGSIDVTRFYVKRFARDIWPAASQRHTPGDPDDQTDIRVVLPEAVAPGDEIDIEMAWTAVLPSVVLRTGFVDHFHMVAQWFPKLARLEPDGNWAHFPYERLSEFYADLGHYDVTITAPSGYTIAAPGRAATLESGPALIRRRHVLSPAHDFAFAVYDDFERLERVTSDGVKLRCFVPRGLDAVARAQLDVVQEALPFFSRLYGPYPYDSLTIVHPIFGAVEAGGMEYPGLITTGGRALWSRLGVRTMAAVTVHELAHQWFYGLLASDEHRWPFLDEGLATYSQADWMESRWPGASAASSLGFRVSLHAINRAHAAPAWGRGAIARPAADFADGSDYGALVYGATASVIETLARIHGRERVRRALGRYAKEHRFGHPQPHDLLTAFESEFGVPAVEWVRAALLDGSWLDWRARFDGESAVWVEREGDLNLGVDIDLVDATGARHRMRVDGGQSSQRLQLAGGGEVVAAIIDPETKLLIDADLSNNAVSRERQGVAPRVWHIGSLSAQLLMGLAYP
ncbi:MAG: M1 family metallopeptidase [Polyangiaceae bacterium]